MAPANSGFRYACGGFEGHAEHHGIAVGDAAVHAACVVCNGRLGPVMTAAAVVLAVLVVTVVAAVRRFFAALRMTEGTLSMTGGTLSMTTITPVAALVIRVVMMAMVTYLVLSVATFMVRIILMAFMLREEVNVL